MPHIFIILEAVFYGWIDIYLGLGKHNIQAFWPCKYSAHAAAPNDDRLVNKLLGWRAKDSVRPQADLCLGPCLYGWRHEKYVYQQPLSAARRLHLRRHWLFCVRHPAGVWAPLAFAVQLSRIHRRGAATAWSHFLPYFGLSLIHIWRCRRRG